MAAVLLKLFAKTPKLHRRIMIPLTVALVVGGGIVLGIHFLSQKAEVVPAQTETVSAEADASRKSKILRIISPSAKEETLVEEPDTSPDIPVDEWDLILVNRDHPLEEEFSVPELKSLSNGHSVDSRIYDALNQMLEAARADGCNPVICSSYRTLNTQTYLFRQKTQYYRNQGFSQELSENLAALWVARPGTSEHHTGLAVDLVDYSYQNLDEKQEDTATQKWLLAHSAEYGFILRYPTGKSALTGINYEPWHYRYVGVAHAKAITEQGICLEEYLAQAGS